MKFRETIAREPRTHVKTINVLTHQQFHITYRQQISNISRKYIEPK